MAFMARVEIDPAKVDQDITGFPLLVLLEHLPAGFWNTVQDGGGDIRVFKADGVTELPREVVSCSTTTETGELWVRLDGVLSSTVPTVIQIHALGAGSDYAHADPYGRNSVWQDYEFVLHLRESGGGTSGEYVDSTGNGYSGRGGNGLPARAPSQSAAYHPWGGTWQDFDGSDDYILLENSAQALQQTPFTIQCVFRMKSITSVDEGLLGNRQISGGAYGFYTSIRSGGMFHGIDGLSGAASFRPAAPSVNAGHWHVMTFGGGLLSGYLDGEVIGSADASGVGDTTTDTPFYVGSYYDLSASRSLSAYIGEVRGTKVPLSQHWIKAEYNNQAFPQNFYSVTEITGTVGVIQGAVTINAAPAERDLIAVTYAPQLVDDGAGGTVEKRLVVGEARSAPDGTYTLETPGFIDEVIVLALDNYGERWKPNTEYAVGARVRPTKGKETGYGYDITVAGNSGATEPVWWVPAGGSDTGQIGTATAQARPLWWSVAHAPILPDAVEPGP